VSELEVHRIFGGQLRAGKHAPEHPMPAVRVIELRGFWFTHLLRRWLGA
jgi:hypothetical protein